MSGGSSSGLAVVLIPKALGSKSRSLLSAKRMGMKIGDGLKVYLGMANYYLTLDFISLVANPSS